MKKIVSICLTLLATVSVGAQIVQNQQQRTTLYIDVTVDRHEVIAGPYARYAQKYLGVAAPLADKVIHEIAGVKLLEASGIIVGDKTSTEWGVSHMNPRRGFPRLTVDKTSALASSLEENARLAAEKIFAIRKSRLDLVTGEAGENVFGGGLGSALAELNRLEEEYLSLFLGKQATRPETEQYRIIPTKGKSTYTVCRFSEDAGLLPEDDLSGAPMVLELKPVAEPLPETAGNQAKPSSRAVPHLVPAEIRCRVILDGAQLASEIMSIWQLGETVYLAQ